MFICSWNACKQQGLFVASQWGAQKAQGFQEKHVVPLEAVFSSIVHMSRMLMCTLATWRFLQGRIGGGGEGGGKGFERDRGGS